tara:strand:- start:5418 stop:6647 length:1230 start_codon:yes stop_codon:yes gene_type:complete
MKNFLKNIKKGIFPSIIAFSALSVSASAAFYSVSGLSKLFAGASFEVIIMAGSLEIAKLVIASLLYQYWNKLNKWLKYYLVSASVVLVLITSMGIYGFLSAAYQETYSKLSVVENQKGFIQQKIDFYDKDVTRYDKELERISANISTLSNARSQSIQVRDTSVAGGVRTTISTSEIRLAAKRIETEEQNRKNVQFKREIAADSLQKFQFQILELSNDTEVAGELGPLQYLSGLTGTPMDKIINWLLLVIIFVFDPLAISLVIAANFAFDKAFPKKEEDWDEFIKEETYEAGVEDDDIEEHLQTIIDNDHALDLVMNDMVKDLTEEDLKEIEVKDAEEIKTQDEFMKNLDNLEKIKDWEEAEQRMEIIGQNGNNGEHYHEEEPPTPPEDFGGGNFRTRPKNDEDYNSKTY